MKRYKYSIRKYKKYKQKGRSKKLFWFGFLFGVVLTSGFYFFIFSPIFQVKEIKVSGNLKVPIEEIQKIISDKTKQKIIFFNLKNILLANLKEINEAILKDFPQVARVTLEREFPNVLAAQIEERKPVAIFNQKEENFFIDEEGVIFEKVIEPETKMLKIKSNSTMVWQTGEKVFDKEEMESILKIKSKIAVSIEEILVVSRGRLNVKTTEGWEIFFNPQRDLNWQLEELSILLKEKISPQKREKLQYIDLRFDKIYIFPSNIINVINKD